ncbi:hypothetical protein [Wolbachia pipientis]|uniref:hypothetical protein n=1 Tax=Wolbachia pipientis TaxID=955 RepID=UPI0025A3738F|nr:hypothetical protein [Wolbachia pipientis]MDM8335566.1 hypothetical protein [Wolbachia pipientis]
MDKEFLEFLGVLSIVGAAIGALTGVGLSFTALSPLVISEIVAAVPLALLSICGLFNDVKNGSCSKRDFFMLACLCVAGAAIGVGLAKAATAIFPGAMLGMGSVTLTGALIGAVALIAAILAAEYIIEPIAEKVNEYIISPTVERFSSKGKECKPA